MTKGKITLKIVREFESHCTHYFINAKDGIPDEKKVMKILGCFEESVIDDWTSTHQARLIKMTFPEFMKEFRKRWLPHNWEKTVRNEMLGTHLNPDIHRFETWAAQIMAHNVSLRETSSFMTDEALRTQLEIMLDTDLQITAHEEKADEITDLQEWMTRITEIDNKRQKEMKRINSLVDARVEARAAKRQNTGQNQAPQTSNSYTNN